MRSTRHVIAAGLAGLAAATLLVPAASAQQVYRIVGPDGRVTFSDKLPTEPNVSGTPPSTAALPAAPVPGGSLPFELRQVASRYPVMLYTGPNCGPCASGRTLLASRGVPFTEKTVSSNEDIEALQRLSGAASLPFMTVGGQQLKGFSEVEWSQFLDAAGYPKTSQLPAAYRQPPATPLVAVQAPAGPAPVAPAEPPRVAAPAPARAPDAAPPNPAGIRF